MTFEQWLKENYPQTYENKDTHGMNLWVQFAKEAFEAGKGAKKEVTVGFNPIHGDWYVFSEDLAEDVSTGHYSKRSAIEWAQNNGYRVMNNW